MPLYAVTSEIYIDDGEKNEYKNYSTKTVHAANSAIDVLDAYLAEFRAKQKGKVVAVNIGIQDVAEAQRVKGAK